MARLLDGYGQAVDFAAQGGGASDAGDLAWTYGTAHWSVAGAAKEGHYVRIWQKRAEGWKLVFAQILPGTAAST